jgi:AraC-like DNA-binding protein
MYLQADIINGQEFAVYDDENMTYDFRTRKYTLTPAALLTFLNLDLGLGDTENRAFIAEQRDNVYRALLSSIHNPLHTDVVLWKIAKTQQGRDGIMNAMLSQVRYARRTFRDMFEDETSVSPNAIEDLRQAQLWHKGRYGYTVDPDKKGVGY